MSQIFQPLVENKEERIAQLLALAGRGETNSGVGNKEVSIVGARRHNARGRE